MKNSSSFSKVFLLSSCVALSMFAAEKGQSDVQQPKAKPAYPPFAVVLAKPKCVFETSFTGLALQPFANNLDYAAEALPFNYDSGDADPAISPSWVIPVISPDFHFGFDLRVAGIFKDVSSKLMLNWERYHSSDDSASLTVDSINNMIGTFFEIGPDASTYKKGSGKVSFHFDEVNLDYGTIVRFGRRLYTNLFAGVGFGRLVQHRLSTISNLPGTISRTLDVPSEFMGAGPQLGFDFNYKIIKGFQFVGEGRGTLFVGTFKNSTTYSTTSSDLVTLGDQNPNIQTTTVDNKGGIVPGFETKLGLAYKLFFRQHYMFKIEAGYQAQLYLNSIRSIDMGSEVTLGTAGTAVSSTTGVYARTFDRTVSDFALAGPYATVDFAF